MVATVQDVDDFMTLAHRGSRHGPEYVLRVIFDRTVTLKYIAINPDQAEAFLDYDAIDWDQLMNAIQSVSGLSMNPVARARLDAKAKEARARFKGEPCSECGQRKQTSWTPHSVKVLAEKVSLNHLHTISFLMPSKMMHPTLLGLKNRLSEASGLYNALNSMHYLLVETVLIHRRHQFGQQNVTPMMREAVRDFLRVWVFSETDFGGLLIGGSERDHGWAYYGPVRAVNVERRIAYTPQPQNRDHS
jgi:hypothetical protein